MKYNYLTNLDESALKQFLKGLNLAYYDVDDFSIIFADDSQIIGILPEFDEQEIPTMCRFTAFEMEIGKKSYSKPWSKFQYARLGQTNKSIADEYVGDCGDFYDFNKCNTAHSC
ncbi:MAG: hypothetical protein IJ358_01525 [Clostridia bacterium]|nr:hypothetical protein [Clostridia bacterium]